MSVILTAHYGVIETTIKAVQWDGTVGGANKIIEIFADSKNCMLYVNAITKSFNLTKSNNKKSTAVKGMYVVKDTLGSISFMSEEDFDNTYFFIDFE